MGRPERAPQAGTDRGGFTLMEVLIITAILGIIVLAGAPMLSSTLTDASLSPAAAEVRTALEFAQLASMTTGMPCRVIIDDGIDTLGVAQLGNTIDFADTSLVEIPRTSVESESFRLVRHPLRPGAVYSIDFANEARFHGVDITAATFGPGNSVIFNRFGVPSYGGSVTLLNGQRQIVVTVDGLTGRVEVTE